MNLTEVFKQHIARYKSDRIGVAFSGGKDSVVLASLLKQVFEGQIIYLFHINHRLQGEDHARTECDFVDDFAGKYGFSLERRELNDPVPQDEDGLRRARYQLLSEMGQKSNLDWLATAHHGDDQVETFLMRLLRGTDLRGLRGIPSEVLLQGQKIIRPLLPFRLSQLEAWREKQSLPYFEDQSNSSLRYFRNRIRHQLAPLMEDLSAGSSDRILDLSQRIGDHSAFVETSAESILGDVQWEWDEAGLEARVARKILQDAPFVLIRLWCRKCLSKWAGGEAKLSSRQIDEMARFIQSDSLGYFWENFPGNIQLRARKRELIVRKLGPKKA